MYTKKIFRFLKPFPAHPLEETPSRRMSVTSSLNEISPDQLGNRAEVIGEVLLRPPPTHFLQQASGQLFKDDVNDFSYISNISLMHRPLPCQYREKQLPASLFDNTLRKHKQTTIV
jgi:hypothetical protein